MDHVYFVALDDEAAAAVYDWPSGPHRPPAGPERTGVLPDVVPGPQFSEELGYLAELLAGGSWRTAMDGEYVLRSDPVEYARLVAVCPRPLTTGLAALEDDQLGPLAQRWSAFEDLQEGPEELTEVLRTLRGQARRAVEAGGGLYVFGSA